MENLKLLPFVSILFCSLAHAQWQDVYTITSTNIKNQRVPTIERTSDFTNCDYRLKLPKNRYHRGDAFYSPTQSVSAVHFINELIFPLQRITGIHAVNSNGNFYGPRPPEISLDNRNSYTITFILGRGPRFERLLHSTVTFINHASPLAPVITINSLPDYEPVFIIQRKCVSGNIKTE